MGGLKGFVAFLATVGGIALLLRFLHVGLPLLVPDTRTGPYPIATLDEARSHAGFAPLLPAYRPQILGEDAPSVLVTRIPRPVLVIRWQGERFLSLEERRGGAAPEAPPDGLPLDGLPDAIWWREGAIHHAVLERDGLWIHVRTDLPPEDLRRIAATLRPL